MLGTIRELHRKFDYWRCCYTSYFEDCKRYVNSTYSNYREEALIAKITSNCHSVEKGFTMSEFKYGFGQERVERLIDSYYEYIKMYGEKNIQIKYVVDTIYQYYLIHENHEDVISPTLLQKINKIVNTYDKEYFIGIQKTITREDYFSQIDESFEEFSNSRHSCRNFSEEEVSTEIIKDAVKLSQNAPSACNRQATRIYIVKDKELIAKILKLHNGNRGFGHLFNKLIVVTGYLGGYSGHYERNTVFIDTGIFSMNLLYSLHYKKVAACILNWSGVKDVDEKLRRLINIPNDEKISVLIGCGQMAKDAKICLSRKKVIDNIINII